MRENITTGIKVGDVMARNFIFVKPQTAVFTAVDLMVKKRVGSLIIQEEGLLKGILTEKDIMWALSKTRDLSHTKAIDIASRKITTIKPDVDIYHAVKVMRKAKFRRLPVVVKKQVIGILTLKDILRIQPALFELAREGFQPKEVDAAIKEGICQSCERYDLLYNVKGKLFCIKCK